MILIKHRKGSNWPQKWVVAYCCLAFYFFKLRKGISSGFRKWDPDIEVSTGVNRWSSNYTMPGKEQYDWRKVFGSRSGLNTPTNLEEIAVYRCLGFGEFEAGRYVRVMADHFIDGDIKKRSGRGDLIFKETIKLSYWIPAFPWAGGDPIVNQDNYVIGMGLRYIG